MDVKPSKGVIVNVNAQREAIFGDESVSVQSVALDDSNRSGVMTGMCLAGFCEVEMQKLDGKKHWFPIDDLSGEHGEKIVEDEIQIDEESSDSEEEEE